MQILSRKGWLVCAVLMMLSSLVFQSRGASATVSSGRLDDFQTNFDAVVSDGGGTITVTAPILVGDTNGTANPVFDGGSNVVLTASSNSLFIVGDGSSLSLSNMALEDGVSSNGGAVYIFPGGVATFTDCLFSNNVALGASGSTGVVGTNGTISGSRRGGAGEPGLGGAIFNLGTVSVFNCVFVTNSAIGGGGGDGLDGGSGGTRGGNGGNGGAGGAAFGGGIYTAGSLVITNTTFSDNIAQGGTGGTNGAGGSGLVPGVAGAGGIGGSAGGGGLYCTNTNAVVMIFSSTFANNLAQGGAGQTGGTGSAGLGQTGRPGGSASGGGIDNDKGSTNVLINCTFFQDVAKGGAAGNGGDGGGRGGNGGNGGNATGGGIYNAGTVTVVNCTFSQGGAVGGTNGVAGSGIASAKNGSRGASHGGNIANVAKKKGSFVLANSIVGTNLSGGGGFGSISDSNYNISADRSIVFRSAKKGGTSLMKTDPLLGALAANGGPTETISLQTNSPAVDFIPTNQPAAITNQPPPPIVPVPAMDQRGKNRPIEVFTNDWNDAGAFELDPNEIIIKNQPQGTNVPVGSNAVFIVVAQSLRQPLFYQWFSILTNVSTAPVLLDDETNTSLMLTNVQLTNNGEQFLVVITNTFDAATSSVATLNVFQITNSAPVITTQPISQSNVVGGTITFTVAATGSPTLIYQWTMQDPTTTVFTNVPNATNAMFSITNLQTINQGNYRVTITNDFGATNSDIVQLIVSTNSSSGGGPNPTFLRSGSANGVQKASMRAASTSVPVVPDMESSTTFLDPGRVREEPQRSEFHKNSISQAAPPDCAAIDVARLWAFWKGARPPDKIFPCRSRSARAIA